MISYNTSRCGPEKGEEEKRPEQAMPMMDNSAINRDM
jgi:hypothetical protein